ncbi:MAG: gliding motility-associated C-terminal domain-containing protein [Saprospiraceae bacterium]|nr:gliding motility-associated C-terminal domain-containing protein [Saprospiraceae bacterium]
MRVTVLSRYLRFTVGYLDADIIIPNSSSPHGDQVNELFEIFAPNYEVIGTHIYNRWGIKYFQIWTGF